MSTTTTRIQSSEYPTNIVSGIHLVAEEETIAPKSPDPLLVVAVSTRALFHLEESHKIYVEQGKKAFIEYQRKNEDVILKPGAAFNIVKKMLALKNPMTGDPIIEVIMLTSNSPDAAIQVKNSVEYYNLRITRGAFTGGEKKFPYLSCFGVDLFLDAEHEEVLNAISAGHAAGIIMPSEQKDIMCPNTDVEMGCIRIAFDWDRVLADGASDMFYRNATDKSTYFCTEKAKAKEPVNPGPFKRLLEKLCIIKELLPDKIKIGVFTSRSAPADLRVIYSLRQWNLQCDAAFFIGSHSKAPMLVEWNADIFFDDSMNNFKEALAAGVFAAKVPPEPKKT